MRNYDALVAFIAARERVPFAWAGNHCAAFGAGAVQAQTGRNPLRDVRVTTEKGALLAAARRGGLAVAISARLRPIAPSMARRGDIAGVPDDAFGVRVMVVEGETLVGPGPTGNRRAPPSAMICAWSAD